MNPIEIKFLFEGVIFSSEVNIMSYSNKHEFVITQFCNYLKNKFSETYNLVLENRTFKPVNNVSGKEAELVKSIQSAILNNPTVKKTYLRTSISSPLSYGSIGSMSDVRDYF